jgi:hypothetical protein
MTASHPAPAPSAPLPPLDRFARLARQRLTAAHRAPSKAALEPILVALVLDAREYAAAMIERHARPDDRWGPR